MVITGPPRLTPYWLLFVTSRFLALTVVRFPEAPFETSNPSPLPSRVALVMVTVNWEEALDGDSGLRVVPCDDG
jgi:hypothetical protein